GWWIAPLAVAATVFVAVTTRRLADRHPKLQSAMTGLIPRARRAKAVGDLALGVAELTRAGVPLVEALRVAGPTVAPSLRPAVIEAARRVERGEVLVDALDDRRYFSEEFSRLLSAAQATGELDRMLARLGERHRRQA